MPTKKKLIAQAAEGSIAKYVITGYNGIAYTQETTMATGMTWNFVANSSLYNNNTVQRTAGVYHNGKAWIVSGRNTSTGDTHISQSTDGVNWNYIGSFSIGDWAGSSNTTLYNGSYWVVTGTTGTAYTSVEDGSSGWATTTVLKALIISWDGSNWLSSYYSGQIDRFSYKSGADPSSGSMSLWFESGNVALGMGYNADSGVWFMADRYSGVGGKIFTATTLGGSRTTRLTRTDGFMYGVAVHDAATMVGNNSTGEFTLDDDGANVTRRNDLPTNKRIYDVDYNSQYDFTLIATATNICFKSGQITNADATWTTITSDLSSAGLNSSYTGVASENGVKNTTTNI